MAGFDFDDYCPCCKAHLDVTMWFKPNYRNQHRLHCPACKAPLCITTAGTLIGGANYTARDSFDEAEVRISA